MNNIVKLGYSEAAAMTIVFLGTKVFLGYPRTIVQFGSTTAWLVILINLSVAVVVWLVISSLLGRYPGKSIMTINELVLGPVLGLGANVLIFFYATVDNSIHLRLFSEAVILTALPQAPISSLAFLFIIPVWLATYLGLEALSRSSYIAFPFVLVGVIIVLLALYPYWDSRQLLPIMGEGLVPILKYGVLGVTSFAEVILLAYYVPFFAFGPQQLRYVGLFSLSFIAVIFLMVVITYLMVFPFPSAMETLAPFYQLSRTIFLGRYFQRVEALFVLFWTFIAFLRLALGVLVSAIILQDTLKLPYYRPLLPALCILIFSVALTPISLIQAVDIEKIRIITGWLFTMALPCGVWLVALLRGKGEKSDKNKPNA
ncbi:MAG: GerAB/ArcD/ProY family transporter [Bacillota bacterium]|uniref:GerAB/ArcD/ProY family transporter n=1 Tax=Thermanaerosceptrum fracticalcis TaxID=1712410 RepID=A0A7G6E2D4_THEFR|nr:GerAB/ArcD/ProY family transporter [Thermanaerosceptrum fracticalcis]QNB46238.1 GerAB/ArcD/ProY family transporter [Thermanaerosceptrum fracticalcis]